MNLDINNYSAVDIDSYSFIAVPYKDTNSWSALILDSQSFSAVDLDSSTAMSVMLAVVPYIDSYINKAIAIVQWT